jgi:hypothetical protein
MGVRRVLCVLALSGGLLGGVARAQTPNPNFDAVPWSPLGCGATPLTAADPRPEVNLVGDATFPAVYTARDATYLYFRYRVDGDPRNSRRGFLSASDWTTLVQVPSGDPFQYQYQLSLNGDGSQTADTLEIWANSAADDLTFNPLFTDESDTKVFSIVFDDTSGGNTTPLARGVQTGDGSMFGNDPDFFVDVAFPIQALIANGVIAAASDLDQALFFPATGSSPNRHNKDNLNCPFLPATTLALDESLTPDVAPSNTTTQLDYTIAVHNTAAGPARGIVLTQPSLAPPVTFVSVSVSADDPGVQWTVVSQDPLEVRVPELPAGATFTVDVAGAARPGCSDVGPTMMSGVFATNADAVSASATLTVQSVIGPEVCDGLDNDCNGIIDDGGNALCQDNNVCDGTPVCAGAAGCQSTPLDCNDNNPCTADSCDPTTGCVHTPLSGCTGCQGDADCADNNACTTDTCDVGTGTCHNVPIPGCVSCTTAGDCTDADPCTSDTCNAGMCAHAAIPGCVRCTTPGQCNDGNQCTTDACNGEVCTHTAIPGCTPCTPSPEVCNDGIDNDCDGLVDCADPDCAGSPACVHRVEDCSNCADDDGNGLIDAEDPACCAAPMGLAVDRLMLRSNAPPGRGNHLRLETQYASETPPLFDPLRQDTDIQLSDASGSLLCVRIAASHWHRSRRFLFRFTDRKRTFAGGLDSGEFRINPAGNLLFTARAHALELRSVDPGTLRLTISVGNECSRSAVTTRPARKGLVFP